MAEGLTLKEWKKFIRTSTALMKKMDRLEKALLAAKQEQDKILQEAWK